MPFTEETANDYESALSENPHHHHWVFYLPLCNHTMVALYRHKFFCEYPRCLRGKVCLAYKKRSSFGGISAIPPHRHTSYHNYNGITY